MFCHVVQFGNEIIVVEFFLYGLITKVFGLLTFKYGIRCAAASHRADTAAVAVVVAIVGRHCRRRLSP
jgi:hypothetical protein